MIIKLARMVNGEEIEYIIPVMEAKFTIVDEVSGIVSWDNEDFDVDLTDERIQKKWDEWITAKEDISTKIMESHEIVEYVQKAIDANLKSTNEEHQRQMQEIRDENNAQTEKIRRENDERTEKIRAEYNETRDSLNTNISNLIDTMGTMVKSVKDDVATVNKTAVDMKKLKKDFGEINEMFQSILEAGE